MTSSSSNHRDIFFFFYLTFKFVTGYYIINLFVNFFGRQQTVLKRSLKGHSLKAKKTPGLGVVKIVFILKLKTKRNDWLL